MKALDLWNFGKSGNYFVICIIDVLISSWFKAQTKPHSQPIFFLLNSSHLWSDSKSRQCKEIIVTRNFSTHITLPAHKTRFIFSNVTHAEYKCWWKEFSRENSLFVWKTFFWLISLMRFDDCTQIETDRRECFSSLLLGFSCNWEKVWQPRQRSSPDIFFFPKRKMIKGERASCWTTWQCLKILRKNTPKHFLSTA